MYHHLESPPVRDVREEAGMRFFSLPPCDSDDRISSVTAMPVPGYQGEAEARLLSYQNSVSDTVSFVAKVYRNRKSQWGAKMLQDVAIEFWQNPCYHVGVFVGKGEQVGSMRISSPETSKGLALENYLGIHIADDHKAEIGSFVIDRKRSLSMHKRVWLELWLGIVRHAAIFDFQYRYYSFSDRFGARIFQQWGWKPVRSYDDHVLQRTVEIAPSIQDRRVFHREIENNRFVAMEFIPTIDNLKYLYEKGYGCGERFSLDNPILYRRLTRMGLLPLFLKNS